MDLETLLRTARDVILVGSTVVVQVLAQLALSRMERILPNPKLSAWPTFFMLAHSVAAVMVLMAGHMLQVTLWALVYRLEWPEIGTFGKALYLSLGNFTTVGSTGFTLDDAQRLVCALESAAGVLMFGWSTALLVRVVQRTDDNSR